MPKTIIFKGMQINIENEAGSTRSGIDVDGKPWKQVMTCPYGEIIGSTGIDGDAVDCFIGPDKSAKFVYIITTTHKEKGHFDENKCMLGFPDAMSAKAAFYRNYTQPELHYGDMSVLSVEDFKKKVMQTKKNPTLIRASKMNTAISLYAQDNNNNPFKIGDPVTVDGLRGRGVVIKVEGRRVTIRFRNREYVSRDQIYVHSMNENDYKSKYSSLHANEGIPEEEGRKGKYIEKVGTQFCIRSDGIDNNFGCWPSMEKAEAVMAGKSFIEPDVNKGLQAGGPGSGRHPSGLSDEKLNAKVRSVKHINKILEKLGYAERVGYKAGSGHVYWYGGKADGFYESGLGIARPNHMTVKGFLDDLDYRLKNDENVGTGYVSKLKKKYGFDTQGTDVNKSLLASKTKKKDKKKPRIPKTSQPKAKGSKSPEADQHPEFFSPVTELRNKITMYVDQDTGRLKMADFKASRQKKVEAFGPKIKFKNPSPYRTPGTGKKASVGVASLKNPIKLGKPDRNPGVIGKIRADFGEPNAGAYQHAHLDSNLFFHPPSLRNPQRVPADDPGETNNKFGDVDKRKNAHKQRMDILKRSAPGGSPPNVPVRTTLISPTLNSYMPLHGAAIKASVGRTRRRHGGGMFRAFNSAKI
jgi:hypothetical protein